MEISNAIFHDLESFGKKVFQNGYEKFLGFCFGKFYNILKWM